MEEKQRGGGVEGCRGRCSSCGGQDNSISHVGVGGGGRPGCGGCTQWHCYKGVGMQLIRFGEMDHSLKSSPWEALTLTTRAAVGLMKLEGDPQVSNHICYYNLGFIDTVVVQRKR